MKLNLVILKPADADCILQFDKQQTATGVLDPIEQELMSWHSRSRTEALEHYLPLGWSFAAWSDESMMGYFLAQPLLFYRGVTQTLWVEHLQYLDLDIAFQLIDTAIRLGREKHFQRSVFSDCQSYVSLLKDLKGRPLTESLYEVTTAKMI